MAKLKPVDVYYSIENCGDGSAYPTWFLTMKDANFHNDSQSEGWGETCTGSEETFIGSSTYKKAKENSEELCKDCGRMEWGCSCNE